MIIERNDLEVFSIFRYPYIPAMLVFLTPSRIISCKSSIRVPLKVYESFPHRFSPVSPLFTSSPQFTNVAQVLNIAELPRGTFASWMPVSPKLETRVLDHCTNVEFRCRDGFSSGILCDLLEIMEIMNPKIWCENFGDWASGDVVVQSSSKMSWLDVEDLLRKSCNRLES